MHADHPETEALWRSLLTGRHPALRRGRRLLGLLPGRSVPRCKLCLAPFAGPGAPVTWLVGKQPWSKNPNYCNVCEHFIHAHPGGAEVDAAFLFADVCGSTALAERMSATEFGGLMRRFYAAASRALTGSGAFVDKFVGDEVIGLYLPAFAGADYARRAVGAARDLLREMGHGRPAGPWLPVGVGVHSGRALVGSLGPEGGPREFTALGDAVNVAARMAGAAGAGEVVLSEAVRRVAGLDPSGLEGRRLRLKGHAEPVEVRVLRLAAYRDRSAA